MAKEIDEEFDDMELDPEYGEVFCDVTSCSYCDMDSHFCHIQRWDCQARMDMEVNGIL